METRRRAQQQGCERQSGEHPAQIGADQHSPASEASLLTCQGRWGLGAEARASEVGSQEEDWGWLREHILKGASVPQLARRESGKKSGAAEEARDFFLPLCFLVREERGLRAPPKRTPETGASRGYHRRTPETVMRHSGCCCCHQEPCVQAQVTIYTSPPRSLCSPPLPGSRDPGTSSLVKTQHASGCCNVMLASAAAGLPRIHLTPPPPPA